ncbi:MAG: hypothetical protein ABI778_05530, partial [Ignavibacteriota bacterium]
MKTVLILFVSFFIMQSAIAQHADNYIPVAKKFLDLMEKGKYHEAYQMLDTSVTHVITETQN